MRVFVTGATGYIGNAVALAFRHAGHHVWGLARSEDKGRKLQQNEITPVIGDLANISSYSHALNQADVIVHCAFDLAGGPKSETNLIDSILAGTGGSLVTPRAFIYTSGVWVIGNTGKNTAYESTPCHPIDLVKWRSALEERLLKAATPSSRIAIIRPGCVYGGRGSLTSMWFEGSKSGAIEIVGDGNNHWAMIHVQDLAQAYVLTAEKELNGIALNVVDETRHTVKEMALAAAEAAGIPGKVRSLTTEEATKKYGPLTQGLLIDQQISNDRTSRLLGWHPRHKGFIRDIDLYFKSWKS